MRVLIACEYSGILRDAFTRAGHYAVSCDLLESESPGSHYTGDIFEFLKKAGDDFDLMIAHPPCTYLARAQAYLVARDEERRKLKDEAIEFVRSLLAVNIPRIAIENPIGFLSTELRKPDQIIYPWWFGDPYRKDICLWTKNLPPLMATCYSTERKSMENHVNSRMSREERRKRKSKFFPGVAEAMALQWGSLK